MGVMRDKNGKIIGTMDGPGRGSCSLFACNKTAGDRMRLGCQPRRSLSFDEAAIEREDQQMADSAQATRILKAVAGTLDVNDVQLVCDMLREAGKLTKEEGRSIMESLSPASEGEGADPFTVASDAAFLKMFPNAGRLKPSDYQPARPPKYVPQSAADRARFDEMFPNAGRLK